MAWLRLPPGQCLMAILHRLDSAIVGHGIVSFTGFFTICLVLVSRPHLNPHVLLFLLQVPHSLHWPTSQPSDKAKENTSEQFLGFFFFVFIFFKLEHTIRKQHLKVLLLTGKNLETKLKSLTEPERIFLASINLSIKPSDYQSECIDIMSVPNFQKPS